MKKKKGRKKKGLRFKRERLISVGREKKNRILFSPPGEYFLLKSPASDAEPDKVTKKGRNPIKEIKMKKLTY